MLFVLNRFFLFLMNIYLYSIRPLLKFTLYLYLHQSAKPKLPCYVKFISTKSWIIFLDKSYLGTSEQKLLTWAILRFINWTCCKVIIIWLRLILIVLCLLKCKTIITIVKLDKVLFSIFLLLSLFWIPIVLKLNITKV